MGDLESRRVAYETARLRLARYRVEGDQARARAASHATQVSAEALGVARVGVWLFRDRDRRLVCVSQYIRSSGEHTSGEALSCELYPSYVSALRTRRIIAAEDARTHPITRELTEGYLGPAGITSMLAAPIIRDGKTIGVVCHEHAGPPRAWGQRDLEFASSVADMVTLIFEQADRLELEAALQEQADQRQESQKMEALGRMAGAIAHDFNNVLGTLAFYPQSMPEAEPAELRKMADELTQTVAVGQRLTQQLLAFGKERGDGPLGVVDFRAIIDRMLPIVRTAIGREIGLELDLPVKEARVAGDPSQLEQVVLNLCLNARDAISGKGTIAIALRESVADDQVAPDCFVFEVKDDGAGMDEATCSRIFEPFYTTKSHGTGLGLATVYGIVKRSGGVVRASSEPGAGTTLLVALPRARAD